MSEHRAGNPWGTEVMATGILAVGLHLAGLVWAARVLLAVVAAGAVRHAVAAPSSG
ncbi:hypothetical protein ACIBI3_11765 [Actinomadura luteofluorescens]|uniref:hypothetical protein n=1 Tax=Actinomadura luteofluorescens TaxID=46163 RepID=UPI0034808FD1